jgi:hypothetical protein
MMNDCMEVSSRPGELDPVSRDSTTGSYQLTAISPQLKAESFRCTFPHSQPSSLLWYRRDTAQGHEARREAPDCRVRVAEGQYPHSGKLVDMVMLAISVARSGRRQSTEYC